MDQLSRKDSDGTAIGQPGDKLGFFTNTASALVPQPSGAAGAALTFGNQCGSVGVIATSQSPAGVVSNGTLAASFTVLTTPSAFALAAGDLVYVNKPTAQAGLGVGNAHISAANVLGISFSNLTGAVVTPTAGQKYGVVALRGFPTTTVTLSPAVVASATIAEQQFTVTGLRLGDVVQVMKPTDQAGLDIMGARVVSNNTLGITFGNVSTAGITPTASESYTVFGLSGMDALNNDVLLMTSVGAVVGVTTATSAEQGVTATGLATSDAVRGVSKPTAQAGLGIVGARVSGANALGITFANMTAATISPTQNEQYAVTLYRPNPAAPAVKYSATLAPASVAASTTAEQGFTVTGLVSGSPVWVNKPSSQSGLGIVGVRVSGANALAITFANITAAAITPATEAYQIVNYQMPIGDNQSSWVQTAAVTQQNTSILTQHMRTALANLGVISGA